MLLNLCSMFSVAGSIPLCVFLALAEQTFSFSNQPVCCRLEGSVVGMWDFCDRKSILGRFLFLSSKMHVCVRASVLGARKYFMEPKPL